MLWERRVPLGRPRVDAVHCTSGNNERDFSIEVRPEGFSRGRYSTRLSLYGNICVRETNAGGVSGYGKSYVCSGLFLGIEDAFRQLKGVTSTAVGYTGGTKLNPSYKDVCTGTTGHAEAVEVEFNPSEVSYLELLANFWKSHDPTTLNRQGPDVGTQYRSAIFFHDAEQEAAARDSKTILEKEGVFKRPIVTQILPAAPFYRAEEYHQQYFEKQGIRSCHI